MSFRDSITVNPSYELERGFSYKASSTYEALELIQVYQSYALGIMMTVSANLKLSCFFLLQIFFDFSFIGVVKEICNFQKCYGW